MTGVIDIPKTWTALDSLTGETPDEYILQNVGLPADLIECVLAPSPPDETVRGYLFDQLKRSYRVTPTATDRPYVRFLRVDRTENLWSRVGRLHWQDAVDNRIGPADAIPASAFNGRRPDDRRLRTESLRLGQRYIVDGIGQYFEWWAPAVPSGQSIYAQFIVPEGFHMALEYRELNPKGDNVFYRVYPEGTYTVDVVGAPIPVRNLRNDAVFAPQTANLVTLSALPAFEDRILQVPSFGEEGGGTGQKAVGALSSDVIFRLLAPGSTFLLELADEGAGATDVQLVLVYALIPEADVPAPVV